MGQKICDGKYEIREFIDRGSFGALFVVRDDGNKRRALKLTEDGNLANEIRVIKSIRNRLDES